MTQVHQGGGGANNPAAEVARDRDGSGEAGETRSGSTEGDSAGRRHRPTPHTTKDTTMTPQLVARLRGILAEATPGPWSYDYGRLGHTVRAAPRLMGAVIVANGNDGNDATLIVEAINALPALLDAVERARVDAAMAYFGAVVFDEMWERFTDGWFEMDINDLVTSNAVEAGFVESVDFDPDKHDDPSGACVAGDEYYLITDDGKRALASARSLKKDQAHDS